MAFRVLKDGKVVQETPKTPLELRLDDIESKIALLQIYMKEIDTQLKDLKKQNGKKTYKTRSPK